MEQETLQTIEAGLPVVAAGDRRSVSPPGFRPVNPSHWRSDTPPPIPRNKSSPSLMDASPKENASPLTMSPTQKNSTKRLHSHAELTPVTRNTSFCDDGAPTEPYYVMVSPADATADLALPSGSDFNTSTTTTLQQRRPLTMDRTKSVGTPSQRDQQLPPMAPVPLVARKFFSFNSRHQYNIQARGTHQPILTPYQPADRETFGVTPSQVSNIFIPRNGPIPLDERQWSIPSIRLANHLGGSTTTLTDEEDLGDDASWSSMGSSLYMPEEEPMVIEASNNLELNLDQLSTSSGSDQAILVQSTNKRTSKQRHASNQNALDWLQNLQHDGLTEAASSKFLTKSLVEYP